jgi:hypothetical protein
MYLNRGDLPWQGMRAKTKKEKYQKIMEKKIATTPDELCKTYPGNFLLILRGVYYLLSVLQRLAV